MEKKRRRPNPAIIEVCSDEVDSGIDYYTTESTTEVFFYSCYDKR